MADDDVRRLATCPVCGYTDTATDPMALDEEIRRHMRNDHNLDPSGMTTGQDVKLAGDDHPEVTPGSPPVMPGPVGASFVDPLDTNRH